MAGLIRKLAIGKENLKYVGLRKMTYLGKRMVNML
jgi:hypothetical protein